MSCSSCSKIQSLQKGINIIKGIGNTIIKTPETEDLYLKRIPFCESCPSAKPLIRLNNLQHYYCDKCLCSCSQKVRVKEEVCPLNKW